MLHFLYLENLPVFFFFAKGFSSLDISTGCVLTCKIEYNVSASFLFSTISKISVWKITNSLNNIRSMTFLTFILFILLTGLTWSYSDTIVVNNLTLIIRKLINGYFRKSLNTKCSFVKKIRSISVFSKQICNTRLKIMQLL